MTTYTPYYAGGWNNDAPGGTPITEAALDWMDAGIIAAHNEIDTLTSQKVAKAGDTMTGDLKFTSAAATRIGWALQTGGVDRIKVRKTNETETGVGNTGGNLEIVNCDDSGAELAVLFKVWRAGVVDAPNGINTATPPANENSVRVPTTAWVRNFVDGFSIGANRVTMATAETYYLGIPIAAAELQVNTHYRAVLDFSNPATANTTTIRFKYGAAGTTADTTIHTSTFTGTANADVARVVVEFHVETINASTGTITVLATLAQRNLGTGATGFHNVAGQPTATTQTATLDTTAARFLGFSIQNTSATTVLLNATIEKVVY